MRRCEGARAPFAASAACVCRVFVEFTACVCRGEGARGALRSAVGYASLCAAVQV